MQLLGVFETAGSLDQAQPEKADIEIDVGLDLARIKVMWWIPDAMRSTPSLVKNF